MPKTKSQITAWCDAVDDYKKDGSNAGEISRRIIHELLQETPGHQIEFGPSGDDYVIILSNGSTNGTYTITGID